MNGDIRRPGPWLLLAAAGVLLALAGGGRSEAAARAWAPGEVLLQFHAGASPAARADALAGVSGRPLQLLAARQDLAAGLPGVVRAAVARSVPEAVDLLRRHPAVAFAEPNWVVTHTATSNDPYYTTSSRLWGMYGDDSPPAGPSGTTNVYGSDAEEAWLNDRIGSPQVYIGVIDEGLQFTHPDLDANVWTNPFDPVDGVDNDGNGYIDDIHGWDFYSNDNSVYDGSSDDHGTHVAGTIGAEGGNGIGVAGMNWSVTMISAKFLGPAGGFTSGAVAALNYLRDLKSRHGLNLVATNNSWGGGGYSQSLHDAILRAAKGGILFMAAAGNASSNNDSTPFYPASYSTLTGTSTETAASYEAVTAVAAITSSGALASFSNYGATSVDLGAPGASINSTLPVDGYGSYSGTSMATPHVTGAAALFAAVNAGATAEGIRNAILGSAVPTSSLAGKTVTGGRLNVGGGFFDGSPPPPPPDPVHDVAVTSVSAPDSVRLGKKANVTVTVANEGNQTESFSVSLAVDAGGGSITPSSRSVSALAPGSSTSVTFSWNTSGGTRGTHVLTATAQTVAGETDTADNVRSTTSNIR